MKSNMSSLYPELSYSDLGRLAAAASMDLDSPISWSALSTPSPLGSSNSLLSGLQSSPPDPTSLLSLVQATQHQVSLAHHPQPYSPVTPSSSPPSASATASIILSTLASMNQARQVAAASNHMSASHPNHHRRPDRVASRPPSRDTPSSQSSSFVNNSSSISSSTSHGNQICRVCGDNALGKNFGVVTCGSCKIFFRRNISAKDRLQCRQNNNCTIGKQNRRNCAACRLEKCIRLGMRVKQSRGSRLISVTNASPSVDRVATNGTGNIEELSRGAIFAEMPELVSMEEASRRQASQTQPINYTTHSQHHLDISGGCSSTGPDYEEEDEEMMDEEEIECHDEETDGPETPASVVEEPVVRVGSVIHYSRPSSVLELAPPSAPPTPSNGVSVIKTAPSTNSTVLHHYHSQSNEKPSSSYNDSTPNTTRHTSSPFSICNLIQIAPSSSESSNDSSVQSTEAVKTESTSSATIIATPSTSSELVLWSESSRAVKRPRVITHFGWEFETDENGEVEQRDGFNYSLVKNSYQNAHTSHQYNNFYTENYYKYYRGTVCDTGRNGSIQLCKVETKNFADIDLAEIGELVKNEDLIRLRLGLELPNDSDCLQLVSKEWDSINRLDMSCHMISAKPSSQSQACAIFDSLERGIFHANRSFKQIEEFWGQNTEISSMIQQNETGFSRKRNKLLHMLYHLRGVQNFDETIDAWAVFNGQQENTFTMIKLDMFRKSIKKEMSLAHKQFIDGFPQEVRKNPTVFNLMTYLLLFDAFDLFHSQFRTDKNHYLKYLYLLKRYLECNVCSGDEQATLQMLARLLKQKRDLSPLCSECLTACTHSLNPQVLKRIGPNYAQCLMLEMQQKQRHHSGSSQTGTSSADVSTNIDPRSSIVEETTDESMIDEAHEPSST